MLAVDDHGPPVPFALRVLVCEQLALNYTGRIYLSLSLSQTPTVGGEGSHTQCGQVAGNFFANFMGHPLWTSDVLTVISCCI